MILTPHPTKEASKTDISFPQLHCWNPVTKEASIAAIVNKNRVLCSISLKLLQERFDASAEKPMQAVSDNRVIIQAAAQKIIEREDYQEDGSVVIRAEDI